MQNFIKLSAAVHELSCTQSSDGAENNTAVNTMGSKKAWVIDQKHIAVIHRYITGIN